jgi:hypothetical protein
MEVAGYPHYENVASNLLAFFFQPTEEHGLGDLFLASLLGALSGEDGQVVESRSEVAIHREHGTPAGGRLDLLVVTDELVIGIENKIYHHLANNFADYSQLINQAGPSDATRIKVVLSLKPVRNHPGMDAEGFVSLSYPQLWAAVRSRLGERVNQAQPKWLNYLLDFMETTTRIAGQTGDLTAADEFFIQNQQIISQLIKDRQGFLNRLNYRVVALKEFLNEDGLNPQHQSKRWIFKESCLVHDFKVGAMQIALDLYVTQEGWELKFFGRNKTSRSYINGLCAQPSLTGSVSQLDYINGCYRGILAPLETSIPDLAKQVQGWVVAISDAITNVQASTQSPEPMDAD